MNPIDMRAHFLQNDLVELLTGYGKGARARVLRVTAQECWLEKYGPYSSPDSLLLIERTYLEREPEIEKQCKHWDKNSPTPRICRSTRGHSGQCFCVDEIVADGYRVTQWGNSEYRWWGANADPTAGKANPVPAPITSSAEQTPTREQLFQRITMLENGIAQARSEASAKRDEALRIERKLNEAMNEHDHIRGELGRERAARIRAEDRVHELTRQIDRMRKAGW